MNTNDLKKMGFTLYNTGGSCFQYYYSHGVSDDSAYLLISDLEGELLQDGVEYSDVAIGVYTVNGDFTLMLELDNDNIETGIDTALNLIKLPIYSD